MQNRIKELRKALKITQADFSKSLNLSENFIWMVESGKRTMSDRTIADIVRKYNVNEEWLRTGEGEMFLDITYEDEVARFCGEVLHADPNDPRMELMHILAKLPPEDWQLVSDFMDAIMESRTKK